MKLKIFYFVDRASCNEHDVLETCTELKIKMNTQKGNLICV